MTTEAKTDGNATNLSEHTYGLDRPLIGRACIYRGRPVVPYGAYTVEGAVLLAVIIEWEAGRVFQMSGVPEDSPELLPLDADSRAARRILHTLLAALGKEGS